MRLLAAVDLGESLETVVASARALAEGLGLAAELLHVVPTPYAEALTRRFPELGPIWKEALAQAEARVGEALGATGLPYRVVRGFPAQAVAGEALRSKVVLLGRQAEGALEALARGGLARYLLHRGEVPVLLLPRPLTQVRRIAVGLDESPASLSAFRVAEAGARPWGRRFLAFTW